MGPKDPEANEKLTADYHFREAERLGRLRRYLEACAEIEESLRLWGRTRALFALAQCHALAGFGGTAWDELAETAALAREEKDYALHRLATDRMAVLERRLARIKIVLAPGADVEGLTLKLDGTPLDRRYIVKAKPLDPPLLAPGTHTLSATAPGRQPWQTTLRLREGEAKRVDVPVLRVGAADASARTIDDRQGAAAEAGGIGLNLSAANTGLFYEDSVDGSRGFVFVSMLTLSGAATPWLTLYGQQGFAVHEPSNGSGPRGTAWSNPAIGAKAVFPLGDGPFSLVTRLELAFPVGSGGGNTPDAGSKSAADNARNAERNFNPNYFITAPAVGLAFKMDRTFLLLQGTFLTGFRARGEQVSSVPILVRSYSMLFAKYTIVNELLDAYAYLVEAHTFSQFPTELRDFLFAALGTSVSLGPVSLSVEYANHLIPPFSRTDDHFLGLIVGYSF